jgi:hypothetical protein
MHVVTGRSLGDFQRRAGVFYRQFEKVLALVNPSSIFPAEFDLGADAHWLDLRGMSYTGKVMLAPASGLVLEKQP